MSRNIALRNRRRREHEAKRGGRSAKTSFVTVEVRLPLSPTAAGEKTRNAVREATGIDLAALDADPSGARAGSGAVALTTFSELAVDVEVVPRSADRPDGPTESDVRVALGSSGRNTGLALVLYLLAALSIVGLIVLALRSRGEPPERARLEAMAARIGVLLRG